jgi:hypothetical protein
MRTPLSLFALVGVISIAFSSSAIATPVTNLELSGKEFCWNDGGTENYYPGGKYSSTHDGHGTWAITDKGVQIDTNQISGLADMQKLPDGTFTATWLVDGKAKTWIGHYLQAGDPCQPSAAN